MKRYFYLSTFLTFLCFSCQTPPMTVSQPLDKHIAIIGHRGACGYRPEHTLASYDLAIDQGADFIEMDLVITKDNVLIARHENEISQTTDVAIKFPRRKTKKVIDGETIEGWFSEDFTLAEIKTLRARERLSQRDHKWDGQFEVPTFEEILNLVERRGKEIHRDIGIYPETKHPSYFRTIGLPLEEPLLKALKARDWVHATSPVIIQSFERSNLKNISEQTKVRLVFLVGNPSERPFDHIQSGDKRTYGQLMTPAELQFAARFLYGIGPAKQLILPEGAAERIFAPTSLVSDAHAAGLRVHPFTFRSDNPFLHSVYGGKPEREYQKFRDLGVDGVFTDFPDHARAALQR